MTFGDTSGKIIFAVGNDRNTKETTLKNVKINLKKLLTSKTTCDKISELLVSGDKEVP